MAPLYATSYRSAAVSINIVFELPAIDVTGNGGGPRRNIAITFGTEKLE